MENVKGVKLEREEFPTLSNKKKLIKKSDFIYVKKSTDNLNSNKEGRY